MATSAALPQRPTKPPPAGPAPSAPPPSAGSLNSPVATANGRAATGTSVNGTPAVTPKAKKVAVHRNGDNTATNNGVDPQIMYESLKTKIAALEEELVHQDEEELKFGGYFV